MHVHPTSLFENLWKSWRCGVFTLESLLATAVTAAWSGNWRQQRPACGLHGASACQTRKKQKCCRTVRWHRDLLVASGLHLYCLCTRCQVRYGYVLMDMWGAHRGPPKGKAGNTNLKPLSDKLVKSLFYVLRARTLEAAWQCEIRSSAGLWQDIPWFVLAVYASHLADIVHHCCAR